MSDALYFEDFPPGSHRECGSVTVSEAEIIAFARQFDPQPFHTDPEAAKSSIFGGLVASGWHTASLAMRLQVDAILSKAASLGSPGFDELRWLKPVRPNDTLSLTVEVLEARPSTKKPDRGSIRSRVTVRNQKGEDVMTAVGWGMFRRRGAPR